MQDILDDIGHATSLPFTVIAARLAIATLLGAIIGFEREWRNHPAGLRTHILVALAAASFTIIGIEMSTRRSSKTTAHVRTRCGSSRRSQQVLRS